MLEASLTPEPVVPDYGDACVTALVPALLGDPDGLDGWPWWLPTEVGEASRVLLLVLDGLGWNQLQGRSDRAPVVAGLSGGPITTVAPTTTAAALTSISTGVPPGEHGVVGYRIAVGDPNLGAHTEVLNALRWTSTIEDARRRHDPRSFQPCSLFGDQWPLVVTRRTFLESGFTAAHLSDTRLVGYDHRDGMVESVVSAFAAGEAFVYAYWDDIARTAHEFGLADRYDEELAACDSMVDDLLARLPANTAVVVTADHGQVHVAERMLELPGQVSSLIDGQSGEARFRWLHARPGMVADLVAGADEAFGDMAWVRTVEEVVADGWLGPVVTATARRRLGDVALVPFEPVAFVDPAEHTSIHLIGRHGSLTSDEVLVPALCAVT